MRYLLLIIAAGAVNVSSHGWLGGFIAGVVAVDIGLVAIRWLFEIRVSVDNGRG